MKRDTPGFSDEDRYTPAGKRRRDLYRAGERLLGGLVLDLLAEFDLGQIYVRPLRNEGERLISAIERFGRVRKVFDCQKDALKAAFLVGMRPCLPIFGTVYDTLAEMVFKKVAPLFGIGEGAPPPSASGAALPPTTPEGE